MGTKFPVFAIAQTCYTQVTMPEQQFFDLGSLLLDTIIIQAFFDEGEEQ